ncbi:MAG TPA: helix-turn-helix transcriptional regulator [Gaiellaceae bacterium]|nr:helix-turn-helix transcriptional regulator [Gaiellaceae bacterium]
MRYPFLALLAAGPAHGYELKQALEQRFGPTLAPLNAGQVYTTLQRLERDGLVSGRDVPGDTRQKRIYTLTEAGREALTSWVTAPTPATRLRDEFFLKLVLAGTSGITDPRALIEQQRREYLVALRALAEANGAADGPVASLLAEGTALHLEADLRWLDLCESRLIQEDSSGNGTDG